MTIIYKNINLSEMGIMYTLTYLKISINLIQHIILSAVGTVVFF